MAIVREETARDLRCPHNLGALGTCGGSACMMWRWIAPVFDEARGIMVGRKGSCGYCGLAGKPKEAE